jgi:hypothetical protein
VQDHELGSSALRLPGGILDDDRLILRDGNDDGPLGFVGVHVVLLCSDGDGGDGKIEWNDHDG